MVDPIASKNSASMLLLRLPQDLGEEFFGREE